MVGGGRNLGYGAYVVGVAAKQAVEEQNSEPYDEPHAIPLTKESNGYCPICGHWSISTGMIGNDKTGEKIDKCLVCKTIFDPSGLEFIDSQTCECGYPRDFHEENVLFCVKGKELENCQCNKYRPTQVTVKSTLK